MIIGLIIVWLYALINIKISACGVVMPMATIVTV